VDLGVETTPIGDGHGMLIAVSRELDLSTSEQLKPAAGEAVSGRRRLILDLSHRTFIDSRPDVCSKGNGGGAPYFTFYLRR
jgi:anti-anti-sigma regulatory factor